MIIQNLVKFLVKQIYKFNKGQIFYILTTQLQRKLFGKY